MLKEGRKEREEIREKIRETYGFKTAKEAIARARNLIREKRFDKAQELLAKLIASRVYVTLDEISEITDLMSDMEAKKRKIECEIECK